MAVLSRIRHAWNAFLNSDTPLFTTLGPASSRSPEQQRPMRYSFNDRTILTSIITRISLDVAGLTFEHVKTDEFGRYSDDIQSPLNYCLNFEPNLDQGPQQFIQDVVMTMCEDGVSVIVPVDTTIDPETSATFDVFSMRVGTAQQWFPKHIRINLYNEKTGKREDITLEKRFVAPIQNPLYAVMNSPSGTMQRLYRKLSLLDAIDEQSGSGKLDIIIQLPYTIKSETRRQQAEQRREKRSVRV